MQAPQNEPSAEPRTITATSAWIAPTILMRGAGLLEPDGTPVDGEVLLQGLTGSPDDLRQNARRYRPGADPFRFNPAASMGTSHYHVRELEHEKDHADGRNDDPRGTPADPEASRGRALHDSRTS
jgi:hypothetical protein